MKKLLFGYQVDRMPDLSFKIMEWMMAIRDFLVPVERKLAHLGIRPGDSVVDYGCGPGGYIPAVSKMVGIHGRVFAVDVHELALSAARGKIQKYSLPNVTTVMAQEYPIDIPDNTADVIYAFDMFHMVRDHLSFLKELHRIIKPAGTLILEKGHQREKAARHNIEASGLWTIRNTEKGAFHCTPHH
jgi:ubiquinone/menaquinone biosynthesis C-methylase UbiE